MRCFFHCYDGLGCLSSKNSLLLLWKRNAGGIRTNQEKEGMKPRFVSASRKTLNMSAHVFHSKLFVECIYSQVVREVNCGGVQITCVVAECIYSISIYWMPATNKEVCNRVHRYPRLVIGAAESWPRQRRKDGTHRPVMPSQMRPRKCWGATG